MYSYNIKQSLKLISNYAALVLILAYVSANTVNALSFYDDYQEGQFVEFRIINVQGCFILGFHLFYIAYNYFLLMNMYNNYLYSFYPTVHKWLPRMVNTAAISRNKV